MRDPAEKASEGKRRMAFGAATAEYEVARLPDGRFAIRYSCNVKFSCGTNCPGRAFPTREECVEYFRQRARTFFGMEKKLRGDREAARRKILRLLAGQGLFGWAEPELDP